MVKRKVERNHADLRPRNFECWHLTFLLWFLGAGCGFGCSAFKKVVEWPGRKVRFSFTLVVRVRVAGALFKFIIVRVRGAGAVFFLYCGAVAGAGAVFNHQFYGSVVRVRLFSRFLPHPHFGVWFTHIFICIYLYLHLYLSILHIIIKRLKD